MVDDDNNRDRDIYLNKSSFMPWFGVRVCVCFVVTVGVFSEKRYAWWYYLNNIDEWLAKLTAIANFGGMFVFETPTTWNIQTNQLWNGAYEDCKTAAQQQQANIQCPFMVPVINTSIDLVHGMWCH